MPCYRCGTRQVDPDRGQSPWKRGVRADHQVLICPGCQASFDWAADLDRCAVCGGVHLVRRLGEIECKDCGHVHQPVAGSADGLGQDGPGSSGRTDGGPGGLTDGGPGGQAGPPGGYLGAGAGGGPGGGETPGLAEEVERALARVLGRAGRTAGIG
jgi:hypothetical protein